MQVQRLCRAFDAAALVRERYADFGPTLAQEKLLEHHDVRVGRETLRKWLTAAGVWTSRRERLREAHQPRARRDCCGRRHRLAGGAHPFKRVTYLIRGLARELAPLGATTSSTAEPCDPR